MESNETSPTCSTGEGEAEAEQALPAAPEDGLFPIVGVGASAGGIQALEGFLRGLSPDVGAAFVIVMHLDPNRSSLATEILGRAARLPVSEITDGLRIEPGHVYVIPPNALLTVEQQCLRLSTAPPTRHASIDAFLVSLAEQHGEAAIGVVLSGAGADGTAGLRVVKEHGGVTMAHGKTAPLRTVSHTGAAGVEQARAFDPAVVICDIGLPGLLDGYAVARALRAELPGIHLIALSGYAQEDDKRRASEAGFDDHLTKPVSQEVPASALAESRGVSRRATLR